MRKLVSILLALALAAGMTVAVFAANPKITTQVSALEGVDAGEAGPGHEIWIPLVMDAFEEAEEDLTMADVKTSKIEVKQAVRSGSKAIASVQLKEGADKTAGILVTLANPFTSTSPMDFETDIYLIINGKRQGFTTTVFGTLQNFETIVDANTDYVDLSGGETATCTETSGKVEAYLGNGVSVFLRMTKGRQYYGTATLGPDADDDELLSEYSDIYEVVTVNAINLNVSGDVVKIDGQEIGGQNFYVYNQQLEYLGRSNDMLPYSDKYYLAEHELEVPADDETQDGEELQDEEDPADVVNGDNAYPAISPGGNPDTGLPPLLTVFLISGGVSLSILTAAALSLRRQRK